VREQDSKAPYFQRQQGFLLEFGRKCSERQGDYSIKALSFRQNCPWQSTRDRTHDIPFSGW